MLHLTINSIPGRSYQVEYKDSLGASTWLPVGDVRKATTTSLVFDVSLGAEPQRFFRVRLL